MRALVTVVGDRDPHPIGTNGRPTADLGPILSLLDDQPHGARFDEVLLVAIEDERPGGRTAHSRAKQLQDNIAGQRSNVHLVLDRGNPSTRTEAYQIVWRAFFPWWEALLERCPNPSLSLYISPGTPATREALMEIGRLLKDHGHDVCALRRDEISPRDVDKAEESFDHRLAELLIQSAFQACKVGAWKTAAEILRRGNESLPCETAAAAFDALYELALNLERVKEPAFRECFPSFYGALEPFLNGKGDVGTETTRAVLFLFRHRERNADLVEARRAMECALYARLAFSGMPKPKEAKFSSDLYDVRGKGTPHPRTEAPTPLHGVIPIALPPGREIEDYYGQTSSHVHGQSSTADPNLVWKHTASLLGVDAQKLTAAVFALSDAHSKDLRQLEINLLRALNKATAAELEDTRVAATL